MQIYLLFSLSLLCGLAVGATSHFCGSVRLEPLDFQVCFTNFCYLQSACDEVLTLPLPSRLVWNTKLTSVWFRAVLKHIFVFLDTFISPTSDWGSLGIWKHFSVQLLMRGRNSLSEKNMCLLRSLQWSGIWSVGCDVTAVCYTRVVHSSWVL